MPLSSLIRFWPEIPKAGPRFWVIFPPNPSSYNGAQFDFCRVQFLYRRSTEFANLKWLDYCISDSSIS